jgi:hypothetical protein
MSNNLLDDNEYENSINIVQKLRKISIENQNLNF